MFILGADVGGTNSRFSIASLDSSKTMLSQVYPSDGFDAFDDALAAFVMGPAREYRPIKSACLAVAGPVDGKQAKVTNLPWHIDSAQLQRQLPLEQITLLNDFEAVGVALDVLHADDVVTLQRGEPVDHAVQALIGAGTGLGQAVRVYCDGQYHVLATEGGHTDFAAADAQQLELVRFLLQHHDRVSVEKVLSGDGLVAIYQFLLDQHAPGTEMLHVNDQDDLAATISRRGISGADSVAREAIELFVKLFAQQAGNLALNTLCRGGLYIAGGIAPKLLPFFESASFIDRFRAKPPMNHLLHDIPIHVIINEHAGLIGALHQARLTTEARL